MTPRPPKKIATNSPAGGMIARRLQQQEREAREAEKRDGRKRPQYWPPRP